MTSTLLVALGALYAVSSLWCLVEAYRLRLLAEVLKRESDADKQLWRATASAHVEALLREFYSDPWNPKWRASDDTQVLH